MHDVANCLSELAIASSSNIKGAEAPALAAIEKYVQCAPRASGDRMTMLLNLEAAFLALQLDGHVARCIEDDIGDRIKRVAADAEGFLDQASADNDDDSHV